MDISSIPELVNNVAYSLMLDAYEEHEMVHPMFAEVRPVTDDILYGTVEDHVGGLGGFKSREDGAEVQFDQAAAGWQRQVKMHQKASGFSIPERMAKASDAVGRVTSLVQQFAGTWGRAARIFKEDQVAGVLQKGTLTAGSLTYFDNSFPSHIDPYPKYIYDGLPWFDGAHLGKVSGSSYSNIATGGSLTASNIETYINTMETTNAYDERGQRIVIRPNMIIVPKGAEAHKAMRLFGSKQVTGSTNNDINTLDGTLQVVSWNALTDDTSCGFICEAKRGLVVYDSGVPEIRISFNERTKAWEVTSEFYFGVMVTDWRPWYSYGKADS